MFGRARRRSLALPVGIAFAIACLASPASASAAVDSSWVRFGTSAEGRAIMVERRCEPQAIHDVLVVGVIHGNETAGLPIVRRLARSAVPPRTCYWLLEALNPDGRARGTRQNARGVDLNRNFPIGWRAGGRAFDTYFSGPALASEPETRAAMAIVRMIGPDVTIWYHQHMDAVLAPSAAWRRALARTYSRVSTLPMRVYAGPPVYGSAIQWQHAEQPNSIGIVVELPAGRLPTPLVVRHAEAVRSIAIAATLDAVDVR